MHLLVIFYRKKKIIIVKTNNLHLILTSMLYKLAICITEDNCLVKGTSNTHLTENESNNRGETQCFEL